MKKLSIVITVLMFGFISPMQHSFANVVSVYADFDKPIVQEGSPENVIVKVGLSGIKNDLPQRRIPLNIAIVLDKSGSMKSQLKMENARSGAIEIIERLNSGDIVSIITYDDRARVLMPAQPLRDKNAFVRRINQIYAKGSTAMYDGITLAQQEIERYASASYLNRIILLSDGLANIGPQSTEDLSSLGYNLSYAGISVTTVGVGLDYNEDLMSALAASGGGNIYFAKNSDRIPEIFAEEINEALTLVAKNIRLHLECADGVTPVQTIGRKGRIDGQNIYLDINSLYAKNEKDALFEVRIPARRDISSMDAIRIKIEYEHPETHKTVRLFKELKIKFDHDAKKIEVAMNKDIVKDAALTRTAEIKQQAVELADQGRYNEADQIMNQQGQQLEKIGQKHNNDPQLLKEANKMKNYSWTDNIKKGTGRFFRKQMVTEAQSDISDQYSPGYIDSTDDNITPVYPAR
ncbi:MAG: VWA domain-containing protein [Candidatus Omnitrophica bacterium]|nr:VWA domain-containing protein [Candidatus Omnitrophota bacterium]